MSSMHPHRGGWEGLFRVSLYIERSSSHRLLLRIQPARCTGLIHDLVESTAKREGRAAAFQLQYGYDPKSKGLHCSGPYLPTTPLPKYRFAVSGLHQDCTPVEKLIIFNFLLCIH